MSKRRYSITMKQRDWEEVEYMARHYNLNVAGLLTAMARGAFYVRPALILDPEAGTVKDPSSGYVQTVKTYYETDTPGVYIVVVDEDREAVFFAVREVSNEG